MENNNNIDDRIYKILESMFNKFKLELEEKIDKKFKNLYGIVAVFCIIFTTFFGFLFYFVNDQYNTRVTRLEDDSYMSSKEAILNEIREIKHELNYVNMRKEKYNQMGLEIRKSADKFNIKRKKPVK